ncbi:hypothetical protein GGP62_002193 [Salinibacter ruber]|nr:hypothetical protein [Salinibacter ruber]MCS3707206.1 hypothetical protein [Salinibacter ruber]
MLLSALQDGLLIQLRAAILVTLRLPILRLSIVDVVLLRATPQMLRIHATGVVAGVSDDGRKRAVFDVVGDSVGQSLPTID